MDLGFSEMLFIVILALLIFGPRRLPEIGRQLGKALAEFRRAKNEFTAQIEDEVRRLERPEVRSEAQPQATPPGPVLVENNTIKAPFEAPSGTVTAAEEIEPGSSSEYPPRVQGTNA
jgi:sec-independent protein translocase protein TatB